MNLTLPNYQNSILNVTCSLLKHYHARTEYSTLPELDQVLCRNYSHIVLMLLDGLGISCLKEHLKESDGLRRYLQKEITSVFPPTTVAATNAVLSGKPPLVTGYVGWVQYFRKEDSNTVVFRNTDFYHSEKKLTESLQKELEYETIYSQIEKAAKDVKTFELFPSFRPGGFDTFHDQVDRILDISSGDGRTFVYAYWTEPDAFMHQYGVKSPEAHEMVGSLNHEYERLIQSAGNDTLIITIADHGLTDVMELDVFEHPDFTDCFSRKPSLETRACSFFIKEGRLQDFANLFKKYYPNRFLLLSRKEVYESKLLGSGIRHPLMDDFIGDYLAVSVSQYSFSMIPRDPSLKAHHAGLTEEEMMVPLIIYSKNEGGKYGC